MPVRYADAAKFRDQLEALTARTQQACDQATAEPAEGPKFRLGQRVIHKEYGYRGVVAGYDKTFCESPEFAAAAQVESAPRGKLQLFYLVSDIWSGWNEISARIDLSDV